MNPLIVAGLAAEAAIDPIGGQAVIEGVMMRSRAGVSMALRAPDGAIRLVDRPRPSLKDRHPVLAWPLVRGVATMVDSMAVGVRMLNLSAATAAGLEEAEAGGGWALVVGILLAIGLFKVLPAYLFMTLKPHVPDVLVLNLVEGLVRTAIFIAYLGAISRLPEVGRLFQYHGAEHQVINCYEAGGDLTPEAAEGCSPIHPRCGTSFLLITLLLSIVVFSLLGLSPGSGIVGALRRVGLQLLLLPVVAGLSYELIRLAGRVQGGGLVARLAWGITLPGMWLQRLTTRRATRDQLEVAIASLRGALALGRGGPVA